jgi:hypothetical protein
MMKILESYKKIAKSMLTEHAWDRKFGEPLPTLEDVMNEVSVMDKEIDFMKDGEKKKITVRDALRQGEKHPAYKDAKQIADKGQAGIAQKDKKEPSGKLSGGDYDRMGESKKISKHPLRKLYEKIGGK